MGDITEKYQLCNSFSEFCKAPDHSFLCAKFNMSFIGLLTNNKIYKSQNNIQEHKYHGKQHMLNNVPSEFMNSDIWQNNIHNLAENTEKISNTQQELDKMYKNMCDRFFKEMDKYLEIKSRKLLKNHIGLTI